MGLLSLAIWMPIAFGALLLALGRDDGPAWSAGRAGGGGRLSFLVTLPLITGFDTSAPPRCSSVERLPWIERFNVRYHLGVDGISVWFVLLTAFITVVVVISAWEVITERVAPVHGRLPDPVRPDGGVCSARPTACCSTCSSRPR
jgi:NADH-quinone oxidoreductase subunit M